MTVHCLSQLSSLFRSRSASNNSSVTIEILHDLFQRSLLGFNVELPDDEGLEHQPYTVHDVVLPFDMSNGDRVHILVEPQTQVDAEEHESETLGTEAVGKNLGGVGHKHTAETNVVGYVIQENKDDDGISSILVSSTTVIGCYLETGQSYGCGDETGDHAEARG